MIRNGTLISNEELKKAPLNKKVWFSVLQELGRRTLVITSHTGQVIYKKVVIML